MSEIGGQHGWVLVRAPLLGWRQLTSIVSHARIKEGVLWDLFYKSVNPIDRGSTLIT
jgi:hypothetical protein